MCFNINVFLRRTLILLSVLLLIIQNLYAQQAKFSAQTEAKIQSQIERIEMQKSNLTQSERKIESPLRDLLSKMVKAQQKRILLGSSASKKYTSSSAKVNDQLQVEVVVTLLSGKDSDSTLVKQLINSSGGNVRLTVKPSPTMPVEMYCWIYYDKILEIAKYPSIGNISALSSPIKRVDSKLTEGESQLYVDKARQYFNRDGSGIKVGVISLGVNAINNSINSNDLPSINNPTHILNSGDPNDNEGTAMLEIVHDLAPGADLYFAGLGSGDGPNDMATRINQLSNAGCQVIVDDIGWPYQSPQFSDDYLYNTISAYRNNPSYNRSYISAAGNDGIDCWDGTFYNNGENFNTWRTASGTAYINNSFSLQPDENVSIILQWADKWDYARTDYDLYVYDQFGNLFDSSVTVQGTYGSIPREKISFTYTPGSGHYPPYSIRVKLDVNHTQPNEPDKELRLIITCTEPLLYTYPSYPSNPGRPTGQIYGKEMAASLTVGAYPAATPNSLQDFSSRGPSRFYSFDVNGYQRGVITYNTPNVVATNGVQTNAGSEFDPFFGTSASAPHVAGIAALYYSKFPSSNFTTALTSSASSIGGGTGGTYNDQSGFGKADARECLIYSLPSISPGTISSNTNWTDVKVNGTTTINSNITVTVPSNSTAVVLGTVNFGNSNSKIVVNSGGVLVVRKTAVVDPAHVTGNVIFEGGIHVEQLAENLSVLTGSTFGRWEGGPSFNTYSVPKDFFDVSVGNNQVFQAYQGIISNQKYNFWEVDNVPTSSILNHQLFQIQNTPSKYTAQFKSTYNATIQAQFIDGGNPGGTINFMDPWLMDYPDPSYGNNLRNQGMSAPFKSVVYSSNNLGTATSYKGVFLGINPSQGATNYYSVRAPLTQSINGYTGVFQNWSTSNASLQQIGSNPSGYDQKAVVFNSSGATVTANYKGVHLSNDANAFSNNSQRKLIETKTGTTTWLHQVYTSAGHVWIEHSSDGGSSWTLGNNNQPLDGTAGGKNPSIAYINDSYNNYNYIGVVWQQPYGTTYKIQGMIFNQYAGSSNVPSPVTSVTTLHTEPSDAYSVNANPNLVLAGGAFGPYLVTFERKSTSGSWQPGINWLVGKMTDSGSAWDGPFGNVESNGIVSGTNASTINTQISRDPGADGSNQLGVNFIRQQGSPGLIYSH